MCLYSFLYIYVIMVTFCQDEFQLYTTTITMTNHLNQSIAIGIAILNTILTNKRACLTNSGPTVGIRTFSQQTLSQYLQGGHLANIQNFHLTSTCILLYF